MFSIIIINFNTLELISACLESIFKYCLLSDFEIIIVDNDSNNNEAQKLTEKFGDKIKIIKNKKNIGFARANNQGAKIASGEYLFFLNSDTLLKQDILTPLKKALSDNSKIGLIAPRLILKSGETQPYAYGFKKGGADLAWLSGAALIIRREIFEKIGGWEERFFMYFEDVDLGRRVSKLNYLIHRLESITVTHLVGGSPIPYWRRKLYYYRSKMLFILKHNFKLL